MYTVYSQFVHNMSRESPHVLLKVSFEKMCFLWCLEDTDYCTGSDIIWKCIPINSRDNEFFARITSKVEEKWFLSIVDHMLSGHLIDTLTRAVMVTLATKHHHLLSQWFILTRCVSPYNVSNKVCIQYKSNILFMKSLYVWLSKCIGSHIFGMFSKRNVGSILLTCLHSKFHSQQQWYGEKQ